MLWPEGFERNHRRNRYKRIVLFGETFIASVQIEEAKLSHANLPRSEYENLESDLRGGGKRLFFRGALNKHCVYELKLFMRNERPRRCGPSHRRGWVKARVISAPTRGVATRSQKCVDAHLRTKKRITPQGSIPRSRRGAGWRGHVRLHLRKQPAPLPRAALPQRIFPVPMGTA